MKIRGLNGGMRKAEDKTKHCADCLHHTCKNICTKKEWCCDGYCELHKTHKQCDGAICALFKVDSFLFTANLKENEK